MQADSLVVVATGVPAGLAIALAAGALSGAIGALASDLAADGGKLERWKGDTTGWTLGFIGKVLVGAVAALIVLTLNPPGQSWLALIGTALAAGIGGNAIVSGFVATGKVDAAARRTKDLGKTAITQLEQLAAAARAASTNGARTRGALPDQLHVVLDSQLRTAKATLETLMGV
jgi:hypothetical protein